MSQDWDENRNAMLTSTHRPILGIYGMTYRARSAACLGGGRRELILDEVSLELEKGEIVALLGPNGAGKSTLMKLASGVLRLNGEGCSGSVRYSGQDFLSLPTFSRTQKVVYVPSDLRTEFPVTALESVFLGLTSQRTGLVRMPTNDERERVEFAMEQCFCSHLRGRDLENLSGGEKQLVALARALVQAAPVLFLDETLSRMDLNHQQLIGKMLRTLAQEGRSVLLVSHDINLASEWADRIIFLKQGKKVFQGTISEALSPDRIISLYPGAELVVGTHPATGVPKIFFGGRTLS